MTTTACVFAFASGKATKVRTVRAPLFTSTHSWWRGDPSRRALTGSAVCSGASSAAASHIVLIVHSSREELDRPLGQEIHDQHRPAGDRRHVARFRREDDPARLFSVERRRTFEGDAVVDL